LSTIITQCIQHRVGLNACHCR